MRNGLKKPERQEKQQEGKGQLKKAKDPGFGEAATLAEKQNSWGTKNIRKFRGSAKKDGIGVRNTEAAAEKEG